MTEKILLVDDDANVLAGLKRQLQKEFDLGMALDGEQGLATMDLQGPFAVIVSDMKMPGMNGIQFLTKVRERAPDSVRMMLTGNADLQTAAEAVNEGHIFRFLTKPCPPEVFANALRAGIEQYRLITAERDLLEKTLSGSVKVLTELLGLVSPLAFSRASRIRPYVRHIAAQLQLADLWQFELAAMLSQIGCIALPAKMYERVSTGVSFSLDEQQTFSTHPSIGCKLLVSIPRLESIARMIEGQLHPFNAYTPSEDLTQEDTTALGSQILKVALDFDQLVIRGLSYKDSLSKLRLRPNVYNPQVVAALMNLRMDEVDVEIKQVRVGDLDTDIAAVACEDILAKNGLLLVSKGQELTYPLLVHLRLFSQTVGVKEPFRVQITRVS
jgi:response regulator RpfG family c-di-GMP phosphodiesterase